MIPIQDIVVIPEQEQWSQQLSALASNPLECYPHFPQIVRRFEAWWAGELIDRPILIAALNGCPSRPITRRLELLTPLLASVLALSTKTISYQYQLMVIGIVGCLVAALALLPALLEIARRRNWRV